MSDLDKDERDRVIRKIKHCLALSASANENEAATALRQARKLMQKYRLTELDVQLSDVGKSEAEKTKAHRPAWEKDLSSMVASAFGCRSFSTRRPCLKRLLMVEQVIFVGVSPSHEIAKYAFDALLTKLTHARKQYMGDIRAGRAPRGRYSVETRGNHFAHAWVHAVHHKLSALVPEADDLTASDSKALVLTQSIENALIDQFMNQLTNGEGVKQRRTGKMADPNTADLVAGFRDGQRTELNHGIGTNGNEQLALGNGV